jgi:hypothetical protein
VFVVDSSKWDKETPALSTYEVNKAIEDIGFVISDMTSEWKTIPFYIDNILPTK